MAASRSKGDGAPARGGIPQLLTIPEVAEVLRVGRSTAYALIDAGTIPAVRIGPRVLRVRADVLADILKGGKGNA